MDYIESNGIAMSKEQPILISYSLADRLCNGMRKSIFKRGVHIRNCSSCKQAILGKWGGLLGCLTCWAEPHRHM
jgi:hypothetical protein